MTTPIHYLEATMEEAIRLGNIHPRLVRIATVDTQILGYPIPKGAHVVSSSYVGEKPLDIAEDKRSKRSQQTKVNFRKHYEDGMDAFVPERWLDEKGEFDSHQYPTLAFSAGPRVCYGEF
jgi:cytochrome P450